MKSLNTHLVGVGGLLASLGALFAMPTFDQQLVSAGTALQAGHPAAAVLPVLVISGIIGAYLGRPHTV